MRAQRLVELNLAAALSRGDALGPVLAAVAPGHAQAVAHLNAGRLAEGLNRARLDPDLIALAQRWPAAVLPAAMRTRELPHRLELLAAPLATLALLMPLAFVQHAFSSGIVSRVLFRGFYTLAEMAGKPVEFDAHLLGDQNLALVLPAVVLLGCVSLLVAILDGRTMGQAERRQAKAAILALALAESAAPDSVRRQHDHALAWLGSVELVAHVDRALSAAWVTQARQLTLVRYLGFGLLAVNAVVQLVTYYALVASPFWAGSI